MNKKKVVLAGAGTMGASLAQVYALGGWETYLYNRSQKGLDRAKEHRQIGPRSRRPRRGTSALPFWE